MVMQKKAQRLHPTNRPHQSATETDGATALCASDRLRLEFLITTLLQLMHIPAHINGYYYLRESILCAVDNQDLGGSSAKILFSKVAQRFSTTPDKVDRGIRYALTIAWNQCDFTALQKTYGFAIRFAHEKPTNLGFIACVADYYKLKMR